MSGTEMKNEDALNSIYLTCDESGYVSIWGGRPDVERSTMNGDIIYNGFVANSEKMGNFIKPKECISLVELINRYQNVTDMVNHPNHYTVGGIEVFDIYIAKLTPEQVLGIILGNAIKYLLRGNHKKDFWEDFEKVGWYVNKGLELHKKGYFK